MSVWVCVSSVVVLWLLMVKKFLVSFLGMCLFWFWLSCEIMFWMIFCLVMVVC